jgi:hypothetical protein
VVVGFIVLVKARKEIIDYEVSHFATELLSASEVRSEMYSGKDSAQCGLVCSGRKALERTLYAGMTSDLTISSHVQPNHGAIVRMSGS